MRKFESKTIIIYLFLISYTLFINTIGYKDYHNIVNIIITPIFWFLLFLISYWINHGFKERIKFQTTKLQTIFIIITIYLILYFLLGLFLGYSKSIYSHSILGIAKNIWIYLIPIFFIEYIRKTLVNHTTGILYDTVEVILFSLISINLYSTLNSTSYSILFKNISSVIIPSITTNILLTYLSRTCGYYGTLFYRIPQILINITLPILPSTNWYYHSVSGILLPLVTFIFVKNIHNKIELTEPRRILRKNSSLKLIPILIPILFIICFVTGVFKYKPIAILSNSMHPVFNRGDVVVIQKLGKNDLKKIKKYDIIEYILGNDIITHRIIHIEEHNNKKKQYTTMGDNNNAPDIKKVDEDQILGKVIFTIPKIGYPSIWLNDFFTNNKKINVETGK